MTKFENYTNRETMNAILEMDAAELDQETWLCFIEAATREEGIKEAVFYNAGAFYEWETISQETYDAANDKIMEMVYDAMRKVGYNEEDALATVRGTKMHYGIA